MEEEGGGGEGQGVKRVKRQVRGVGEGGGWERVRRG